MRIRKDERLLVASIGGATFMLSAASIMLFGFLQALALDRYGSRGVIGLMAVMSASLLAGVWVIDKFLRRHRPIAQTAILAAAGAAVTIPLAAVRAFAPEPGATGVLLMLVLGAVAFGALLSVAVDRLKAAAGEIFDFEQIQRIDPLLSAALAAGLFAGGVFMAGAAGRLSPGLSFASVPVAAVLGFAALLLARGRREFDAPFLVLERVRSAFFLPRFGDAPEQRFFLLFGAIPFISSIVTGLAVYAFGEAMDARFTTEAEMSGFVGSYAAALTLATLLFAGGAIAPILRRLGLTRSLFIPPGVVAAATVPMLLFPAFWFVIGAKFVYDVIVALQRTAYQSMLEGLPDERRSKVWIWIDGPVTTVGTLVGLFVAGAIAFLSAPLGLAETVRAVAIALLLLFAIHFWLTIRLKSLFPRFLSDALGAGDFKARLRAVEALTELRHVRDRDLAVLIDLARDEREPPTLRAAVLRTLAEIGDPAVFRSLSRLIAHPDHRLRLAAIRSMARFDWSADDTFKSGFSRHALIAILKHGFGRETDREIIDAMIEALVALRDPEIVPFMLAAVGHPSAQARHGALRSLRLFRDPATIDIAKPFLKDRDPGLKAQAIAALWPFPWERPLASAGFADLLAGAPGSGERIWGLYLIGRLRLRDLMGEAASAAAGPDPRERLTAAIALLKNGDERGFTAIEAALARGDAAEANEVERLADHPNVPERQRERIDALIHRHHLHYPVGLPTSEPLRVRLHDIPAECLRGLRPAYGKESDREDRRKIEDALKAPGPSAPKGRVSLIGVEGEWAELATVCLLAHGYLVRVVSPTEILMPGERAVCGPTAKTCPPGAVRLVPGAVRDIDTEVSMEHASPSRLVARLEGRANGAMITFQDREEAGRLLAQKLVASLSHPREGGGPENTIVLALPRGGVVLGRIVADELDARLDVVISRRIGAQHDPEFTIGAVTESGEAIWDEEQKAHTDANYLALAVEKELVEAARRIKKYRAGRQSLELAGKTVVVVDDGMANGYTMLAALASVRNAGAGRVIVAVPIASKEALTRVKGSADEVIALNVPDFFWSIGAYYIDFSQVEDEEVLKLLNGI